MQQARVSDIVLCLSKVVAVIVFSTAIEIANLYDAVDSQDRAGVGMSMP
ncbi:hypothetical protein [Methylobacterium flocculans]|nr:hypothetical protein [Methylobacterium sp. FF17]